MNISDSAMMDSYEPPLAPPETALEAYVEHVDIDGDGLSVHSGTHDDEATATSLSFNTSITHFTAYLTTTEARVIAHHLLAAADRYEAMHGVQS